LFEFQFIATIVSSDHPIIIIIIIIIIVDGELTMQLESKIPNWCGSLHIGKKPLQTYGGHVLQDPFYLSDDQLGGGGLSQEESQHWFVFISVGFPV
jgi:hypothetical protein